MITPEEAYGNPERGENVISWREALENPELMIKHKDDIKDEVIFKEPWHSVFSKYPYLYRKFSDRFDDMHGWAIACALMKDPTLVSDLKDYLHKMDRTDISLTLGDNPTLIPDLRDYIHKMSGPAIDHLLGRRPELSLCLKYRYDPNRVEAAYYITFPHRLGNPNKEEKREIAKRIMEILREEKM